MMRGLRRSKVQVLTEVAGFVKIKLVDFGLFCGQYALRGAWQRWRERRRETESGWIEAEKKAWNEQDERIGAEKKGVELCGGCG